MNIKSIISIFLIWGIISVPAFAEETEQKNQLEVLHQSILNLIDQLTRKGVLTKEVADKLMRDADASAAKSVAAKSTPAVAAQSGVAAANPDAQSGVAATNVLPTVEPVAPGVVRVPYIPDSLKDEMTESIKHEVLAQARGERWGDPGAMPGWLSRISWDGEFRLRYQSDRYPAGNALPAQFNPAGLNLIYDSTNTHNYMRVLGRMGMKARVSDDTIVVFRIGTGNQTGVSTGNQTMGNDYNNYTMVLTRAYVQNIPYSWLELSGGKLANPWVSTDLLWDTNINFEGVTAKLKPQISDEWGSFLTVGAYPYQDVQGSDTNLANTKWLYATQLGAAWMAPNSSAAQLGVALYDFRNVQGTQNTILGSHFYDQTAVQNMQKGNTLMYVNAVGDPTIYGLASKFRELDFTAKMDWADFDPIHVMLTADFVRNLGYNQQEIALRTGLPAPTPRINGHMAMLAVGVPRITRPGEWQASATYKYLERDAVLDALNDQDFHLGGTNAKGFIIGGSYGVDNNAWLTVRWLSSDQIDGAPLSIDTLQVDISARF
ncbi:putative porin [Sideroxydans sp. CL21]|uniref:putative porin n=1 Tax=Sideroxydans sp. CL21 TaxID=2600596 RepID=UPI0024BCEAAE|nr:putative porin [Sideroxydans sp. CL21]